MIKYGRDTLFPTETDAVLGPRTVALWRTSGSDNYLRLAHADTNCPPDPTALALDDGTTEPFRYAFYLVNRNPNRELSAPTYSWLIKGRAKTTYDVSASTADAHWIEFRPYLYVARSTNPMENNYIDGDSPENENGSTVPFDPVLLSPLYPPNFFPAEPSFVAYYYAAALVQSYGSADYRVGVAVVVAVDSLDMVVDVQWYYVLFQGRTCLEAVLLDYVPSWSIAPWIRWIIQSGSFEVVVNGTQIFHRTGSVGDWSPYRLMGMETSWGNTGGSSPVRAWSYVGGTAWTPFVPIGRVAGVRSAFIQHLSRVPVGNTSPIRLSAKMFRNVVNDVAPVQFGSDTGVYNPIEIGDGYYAPETNPLGNHWYVVYPVNSSWDTIQLLERFDTEERLPDPFIEAEWVSSASGIFGTQAQTRFRAGNSGLPIRVVLKHAGVDTVLGIYTPSGGSWDTEGWVYVDWLRLPPTGVFEIRYEMYDSSKGDLVVARATLTGSVISAPEVSSRWLSSPELPVDRLFRVEVEASGSAEDLIVETVQDGNVVVRGVFSPPSIGYWSGETRVVQWVSARPYGSFLVRARLETAEATITGRVLSPLLSAEWVSSSTVVLGDVMRVRARANYINEPLTFSIRHKGNEFLIATFNPPSGGWSNEWREASWTTVPPTGNVEWIIRCGELEVSLWGVIITGGLPEQLYGQRFSLKAPFPLNYWVVRSPSYAVSGRVGQRTLIRLGAGWGLEGTDQGRLLEIDTQYDT